MQGGRGNWRGGGGGGEPMQADANTKIEERSLDRTAQRQGATVLSTVITPLPIELFLIPTKLKLEPIIL